MRRLMKFLHTMGAIGLMGAMDVPARAAQLLAGAGVASGVCLMRIAMGGIATWIFLPSLALTLVAGLLAMAVNRAYQDAGWAWAKLATGILIFEWGFVAVQGPMQQEAALSARPWRQDRHRDARARSLDAERGSLWVLLAVAIANVVLGVWRPHIGRLWPSS